MSSDGKQGDLSLTCEESERKRMKQKNYSLQFGSSPSKIAAVFFANFSSFAFHSLFFRLCLPCAVVFFVSIPFVSFVSSGFRSSN